MRMKTKIMIAGVVVAGVTTGTFAIVRAIKRRTKRALDRKVRKTLNEAVEMTIEDYIPGGEFGKSVFRRFIEGLDNRQLVALCALVQVGHFIKVSEIDPLHPTKEQVAKAVSKYILERQLTPSARAELLGALDTTDAYDALKAASKVLAFA